MKLQKKVLLDTNFILSCIEKKIDFAEFFELQGFRIVLPEQVIQEIKTLLDKKKPSKSKSFAEVALKLIKKLDYEPLLLEGSYVDSGIYIYSVENPFIFVATLDKELQKKLKCKKMIIRGNQILLK
jgi:rRNA-processing protein FCF1